MLWYAQTCRAQNTACRPLPRDKVRPKKSCWLTHMRMAAAAGQCASVMLDRHGVASSLLSVAACSSALCT